IKRLGEVNDKGGQPEMQTNRAKITSQVEQDPFCFVWKEEFPHMHVIVSDHHVQTETTSGAVFVPEILFFSLSDTSWITLFSCTEMGAMQSIAMFFRYVESAILHLILVPVVQTEASLI
ncbi:hypothetical protein ACJX0J_023549, partial [Zea mays]